MNWRYFRILAIALLAVLSVGFVDRTSRPAAAQQKPNVVAPQSELKLDQQVNGSIDRGLEYLASKQRKDGGWHTNNAINSLALLSFMGRGHTPGRGQDRLIRDDEPVNLENGTHFYSAPKTVNPGM